MTLVCLCLESDKVKNHKLLSVATVGTTISLSQNKTVVAVTPKRLAACLAFCPKRFRHIRNFSPLFIGVKSSNGL